MNSKIKWFIDFNYPEMFLIVRYSQFGGRYIAPFLCIWNLTSKLQSIHVKRQQTTADNCAKDHSTAEEIKYYCTKLRLPTFCLVLFRLKTVFYVSVSLNGKKGEKYKRPRFSSHICYCLFLHCSFINIMWDQDLNLC